MRALVGIRGCGVAAVPTVPVARLVNSGDYAPDEAAAADYHAIAVSNLSAPDLAVQAARHALAGVTDPAFGAVLYATSSPSPLPVSSPATFVQRALDTGGCGSGLTDAGCAAAMMAVYYAAPLVEHGEGPVLVVAADRWPSSHIDRYRSQSGLVFADGGAALYLDTPSPGDAARILSIVPGSIPELEAMHRGSLDWYAPGLILLEERERQFRSVNPDVNVKALLGHKLREVVGRALADARIELADCSRFIFPGIGRRIRARYAEALAIDPALTLWPYFAARGHAGCTDPIAGLAQIIATGEVARGGHVLVVGEGAGMHVVAAVVRIDGER